MGMCLNRGEWSEIYSILSLLCEPLLKLVDSDLKEINKEIFVIKSINLKDVEGNTLIKYCLENSGNVKIITNNEISKIISKAELNENKIKILNSILNATSGDGAFAIEGIDTLLAKINNGKLVKASSYKKGDVDTSVVDLLTNSSLELSYSIKSSLGSPATILNASKKTNFLYKVEGLSIEQIEDINSINTKTKLLDRINKIKEYNGKIEFVKVCDPIFDYNLKMIDSNLPLYLGTILLKSYETDKKDLKYLFDNYIDNLDSVFAEKKLADFLEGISFGFFPSKKWDGNKSVNGGLVIVKTNGLVVVLDLVYFSNEVRKYLIKQTKLDSPSSTRYHMLELYQEKEQTYFTLNLQIRYKK